LLTLTVLGNDDPTKIPTDSLGSSYLKRLTFSQSQTNS